MAPEHFVSFVLPFFTLLLVPDVLLPAVVAQSGIIQTTATLSQARGRLAATSSGELVFFGGGHSATGPSGQVDIYDVTSGSWTTATLSFPRAQLAAASSGNLVFFAGGWSEMIPSKLVDIYNVSDGNWRTATLSQARGALAATSVGNLVLFAGGRWIQNYSNVVDIYNVTNNTWTTATLSQARGWLAATSVANQYALFAGGYDRSGALRIVDIYDFLNRTWSTANLSKSRTLLAATSLGNLAVFGGGGARQPGPKGSSDLVDIFAITQTWNTTTLSQARYYLAATSIADIIVFGGGITDSSTHSIVVDLYNMTSSIWFTASLSQPRYWLTATSSINKIFFGGGQNSGSEYSNVVDIFCLNVNDCPIPSPPTSGPGPGVIIGIVIAIVALLIGGVVLLIIFIKRRKRKEKQLEKTEQASHPKLEASNAFSVTSQTSITHSQISFNDIVVDQELSEGFYGKVYLGKWHSAPVALKFCKNKGKIEEFMKEVKLMVELPPHPNVVQVFGVSLDGPQPIIVMEYCAGGSLDKLLFATNVALSDKQKIRLIRGIAAGMLHLHKYNIIHRDLAARNILLTANADPKISDFGMSYIIERASEQQISNDFGPVCWMAPESLAHRSYSKKSDVWSFGIVVYEIVAQCEPHKNENILDIAVKIRDEGLTPQIPSNCPSHLKELMELCWNKQPERRPTFEIICTFLRGGEKTWNYRPLV